MINGEVEVEDLEKANAWVETINQEDVRFLIDCCNIRWQTKGWGICQEIATDHNIARSAKVKPVYPSFTYQQIATQAVHVEELIATRARQQRGANSHEDPIGKAGASHAYVGKLDTVAGSCGIGGRI